MRGAAERGARSPLRPTPHPPPAPPQGPAPRGSPPRGAWQGARLGLPGGHGPARAPSAGVSHPEAPPPGPGGRINRDLGPAPRGWLPPARPCPRVGGYVRGAAERGTRSPLLPSPHPPPAPPPPVAHPPRLGARGAWWRLPPRLGAGGAWRSPSPSPPGGLRGSRPSGGSPPRTLNTRIVICEVPCSDAPLRSAGGAAGPGTGPPRKALNGGARGAPGGAQGPCAAGGFGGRLAAGQAPAEPMGAPGAPGGDARGSEAPRGRAAGRRLPLRGGWRRPAAPGGAARGHTDARPPRGAGGRGAGAGAGASRGARRPRETTEKTLPPERARPHGGYLVDSASSHMLVSKIKPCMSKYKQELYSETANGSINQLSFI